MDDLLPCPFCGEPPTVTERADNYTDTGRICFIACMCGGYSACAHKHGDTVAEATAAWNMRDGKAMAQAVQAQPDEQSVFETWLAEKCPSGDVASVQYQWASSSEYRDFLAQAVQPTKESE